MKPQDERDPWAEIHEIMHPASGAPAILCTLAAVNGELNLTGAACRVGVVNVAPAANDSPWMSGIKSAVQLPTTQEQP